jgi:hypothetical protein
MNFYLNRVCVIKNGINTITIFLLNFIRSNWVFIFSAFIILPFIILSFFNHPSADDYWYTQQSAERGFWKAQLYLYNEITGRYLSSAILCINPLVLKWLYGYTFIPIVIIVLLAFSIYTLIDSFALNNFSVRDKILFSSVLFALYLCRMTDIASGLYWMAGSVTYQLGMILAIFAFAYIIKKFHTNNCCCKKTTISYSLFSGFLLFLSIGSNETVMLMVYLILICIALYQMFSNRSISMALIFYLIIATIGCIIVYFSPGNHARYEGEGSIYPQFQLRHNLFLALWASFTTAVECIYRWLNNFLIIIFTFLYMPYGIKLSLISKSSNKLFLVKPLFSIGALFLIVILSFFPSYWSTYFLQWRVKNIIFLFFLIGWFFNVQVVISYICKKHNFNYIQISEKIKILCWIFIMIIFLGYGNIKTAYKDLITGTAYIYNKQLIERYEAIEKCESQLCAVEPLSKRPKSIFWGDITTDDKHWINSCTSAYFKKTLKLKSL